MLTPTFSSIWQGYAKSRSKHLLKGFMRIFVVSKGEREASHRRWKGYPQSSVHKKTLHLCCRNTKKQCFCSQKLDLRHFSRKCRENLNICTLRIKFRNKLGFEDSPQLVPACKSLSYGFTFWVLNKTIPVWKVWLFHRVNYVSENFLFITPRSRSSSPLPTGAGATAPVPECAALECQKCATKKCYGVKSVSQNVLHATTSQNCATQQWSANE